MLARWMMAETIVSWSSLQVAGRYVCLKEVDISILVICYASDDIEYNKRIPELSNEPLHITQEANSIEK